MPGLGVPPAVLGLTGTGKGGSLVPDDRDRITVMGRCRGSSHGDRPGRPEGDDALGLPGRPEGDDALGCQ
jgi:hypothetical protein